LARLEIRVMFEELLRRMPDWELACPGEPRIVPATFTRAYDRIRITFTASAAGRGSGHLPSLDPSVIGPAQ
jgi:cytochrome P450 family 142 subfamily A polypeptide 1